MGAQNIFNRCFFIFIGNLWFVKIIHGQRSLAQECGILDARIFTDTHGSGISDEYCIREVIFRSSGKGKRLCCLCGCLLDFFLIISVDCFIDILTTFLQNGFVVVVGYVRHSDRCTCFHVRSACTISHPHLHLFAKISKESIVDSLHGSD